ncbi:MAG: hypothetical protein K2K89_08555 [Ruminococcus sp.]|nr:hypothetical protein [Ruminococcus sp.]
MAERNNIHSENHIRFGVFGFKPSVYTGSVSANGKDGIQKEGNYFVDILSNDARSISKNNDAIKLQAFNFSRGLVSSELESSVLEEIFNVESLSTTTIFRHAQENDIPIVTISPTSETKISDLNISSSDKKNIQAELDAGRTVITTQSSVKLGSWSGVGYITISPDGSQEYMISGNYKGGLAFDLTGLLYSFNVTFDLALLSESITLLMQALTAMSILSVGTVLPVLLGVASIEFLIFDILHQSLSYCEYEFKNDMEAGIKIWTSSAINVITLATMGVGKGIGKFAESMTQSKLSAKFGETVINNIKNVGGFSATEINSKIKQLNKLGMTQTTIDTLIKNPKFMFLGDDILQFLGKQGGNQRLLAELVINNGDDFTNALLKTEFLEEFLKEVDVYYSKNGSVGAKILLKRLDSTTMLHLEDYNNTTFKNSIETFRAKLPSWAQKRNNFAYAEVHIDGVTKNQYFAHSSINEEIASVAGTGISLEPKNPIFETFHVNPKNIINGQNAYERSKDTENKILSEIAQNITNKSTSGEIVIYTDLKPCVSCDNVFASFSEMFPNIKITILYVDEY